jgi:MFS transporter, ACS family, hexuronate transporter
LSTSSTVTAEVKEEGTGRQLGRYRWVICALLFFATTINYIDRQVIGILAKDLEKIIGWSQVDYGNIVAAFQAAYAIGLLLSGWLIDRFGTKLGYSLAIIVWSLAGMATALARTPFGFGIARAVLGLGEAANFPAAIKTVAEWFPKKERAFATGIFNAGTNVGAIVAPLSVPFIAVKFGWEWAFILTGAVGFLWLLFWLPLYRKPEEHPKLSKAELAYIQSDPPDPAVKVPWLALIPRRQTAAFAIGKAMTDPIWWFYLFWIPNFLRDRHGFELLTVGLPLVVIYLVADVGSIGGGWLSSTFIKRGWSINAARKTAMLICALCVVPIMFVSQTDNAWVAVGLISIAAAAHQGWSANIFTTTSDMFPRQVVGSVVGIGGMAGAMGGVFFAVLVGYILEITNKNYMIPFFISSVAYLAALLIIHLLVPRIEEVQDVSGDNIKSSSLGAIVGYGFIGAIFGVFFSWLINISMATKTLGYIPTGIAVGAVVGIIAGQIILNTRNRNNDPRRV